MKFDPDKLYTLIKEVFLTFDEGDQYFFGQYGLSVTRFYALHHLSNHPGLSLRELSTLMLTDKSNVTRFVRTLEAKGLIMRQPHESDGRSQRLFLTAEGASLQARVQQAHTQFNQSRLQSSLESLDKANAIQLLEQLKEQVSAEFQRIKKEDSKTI